MVFNFPFWLLSFLDICALALHSLNLFSMTFKHRLACNRTDRNKKVMWLMKVTVNIFM